MRVTLTPPDGATSELECAVPAHDCSTLSTGCVRCEATLRGKGEARVNVNYRAVDGRLESTAQELLLHGDEEEITVSGSFDDDASLARLGATTYRAADPRITLQTVEGAEAEPGYAPSFTLSNSSDTDIVAEGQSSVLLGSTVRLGEGGRWERVYPDVAGGCGFGLASETLLPGNALPTVGAWTQLPPGNYLYVIEFNDAETIDDSNTSRRTTASFEITESDVTVEDLDGPRLDLWVREPDELWAGAAMPTRPGLERPEGDEGSQRADDAPRLADGANISGVLSTERSRHHYRLRLRPGQQGVVRIFARCMEAPCTARVGIHSGSDGHLSGSEGALHRDPPAWSMREYIAHEEDDALVIGCREKCDAGWEFYGRIHVRTLPKDERY